MNVTVELEVAAVAEATKDNDNGVPGVIVIVVGLTVTPGGRPVTETAICPVKPPLAVAESEDVELLPASTAMLPGDREREKSALDGGGVFPPVLPPPQPASPIRKDVSTKPMAPCLSK